MEKFRTYYSIFFLCALMVILSFPSGCVRRKPRSSQNSNFNIGKTTVESHFIQNKGYIYVIFLDSSFIRNDVYWYTKSSERKYVGKIKFNNERELSFTCKTQDGKTGSMFLGKNIYDLNNGNVFLVMIEENNLIIKQHKLDKHYLKPDDDIFRRMYSNDGVVKKFFSVKDLPDYLNKTELEQIGAKFQTSYNAMDYEALYEMMDNRAQAKFNREKFTDNMNKAHEQLGMVEQIKFNSYEYLLDDGSLIELCYKMWLVGGALETANLNVTLIDNGDQHGIRRFNLKGWAK